MEIKRLHSDDFWMYRMHYAAILIIIQWWDMEPNGQEIFRFMEGSLLPQWHHFCHQYRCSSWLGRNPPEERAVWSKAELSTKTFCQWILEKNCENALILTWNSFINIKVKAPQKGMELKFCTQVMWSNQIRAQRPDSQTVSQNKRWRATQAGDAHQLSMSIPAILTREDSLIEPLSRTSLRMVGVKFS